MLNRKLNYGILLSLLSIAVILYFIVFYSISSQELKIVFLDVGQGDAILVSQGQNQLLIDGGRNGKIVLEKMGKYIPFWDRTIETVVATHPDQDHIGGLIDVVKSYRVGTIIETKAQSDSQTFQAWQEAVKAENSQIVEAINGVTIKFLDGAEAKVYYPFSSLESPNRANNNQYSVVIKFTVGEDNFLFTGDLPSEQEMALVKEKSDIRSNILKTAHHGSKYSTSEEFIEAVSPREAIISVGKDNAYGHPSSEVIERLLKHGVRIFRTDEMGDIIYHCNPPVSGENPARDTFRQGRDAGGCKIEFD
jgi:competence protein ComEC